MLSIAFHTRQQSLTSRLQLLKHKDQIIEVLSLLVEKTLSERGYGGSARLIARIMATLTGVYPLDSRFVNTDEWNDPGACAIVTIMNAFCRSSRSLSRIR